jgi:hypothetical protein
VKQAEFALARINGGIRLHPETETSMRTTRQRIHRNWLVFAWATLIIFALAYITH